ncbi:hypothetical protein RJ640_018632 [Escallonia rubra]|uniref:Uncharacterized protein n=1 Tax=Escallonia rubra TaxID=112253 RepID=A0AA88QR73_9ASTE|nr:hypothetical protein RJ640_018632 [Escallonia rubra]
MTAPGKADEFVPHPVKDQLPGVDICVNSNPPWPEAVILAFQHYLVMLGTTVIISTVIVPQMGGGIAEKAQVIQTWLFVAGLNTLLQTWFGTRLPVVMGGSFRFILPSLSIVLSNRYSAYINPHDRFVRSMRGIQGALMVASVLPILAGFLGVWRIVTRILSPLSAVPLVTLVGLGLYQLGFPLLANCIELGLPELIILILLSQYFPYMWKSRRLDQFAVLISVAIVWAYASLLTAAGAYKNRPLSTQLSCRVDRSGLISGASWIKFPYPFQWGTPTLDAGDAFVMMAAALVALIESTGTFIAASRYSSATPIPPSVLSRGAGWLGIGLLLDGLFGTASGCTASVKVRGRCRFYTVANIWSIVLYLVRLHMYVLLPNAASAGLGLLQFCHLNSYRTKFILGFSLFMGLSVPQYFNQYVIATGVGPVHTPSTWFNNIMLVIFTSPATVAAIVALFLDCTLARKHSLTRRDSGRHWWGKFKYFDKDPRSAEFYALPLSLSKYFPSV